MKHLIQRENFQGMVGFDELKFVILLEVSERCLFK